MALVSLPINSVEQGLSIVESIQAYWIYGEDIGRKYKASIFAHEVIGVGNDLFIEIDTLSIFGKRCADIPAPQNLEEIAEWAGKVKDRLFSFKVYGKNLITPWID